MMLVSFNSNMNGATSGVGKVWGYPLNTGVNSGAPKGLEVSAPLVTLVVLPLNDTNII